MFNFNMLFVLGLSGLIGYFSLVGQWISADQIQHVLSMLASL